MTAINREKARPSSTQDTDKCVHTASSLGLCQCKREMEQKFQDFKKLTGDIFKEQLQEQLNEKTKKLETFSDNLIRENVRLRKDNDNVDALRKLHDNVSRQVSIHETLIDKQKKDISTLQSAVNGLTEQNKELQVVVTDLTERNKEHTDRNEELTGGNEKLQVTVNELKAVLKELQSRMTVVEDKVR